MKKYITCGSIFLALIVTITVFDFLDKKPRNTIEKTVRRTL